MYNILIKIILYPHQMNTVGVTPEMIAQLRDIHTYMSENMDGMDRISLLWMYDSLQCGIDLMEMLKKH